ncbi:MAG TPA: bifunctional diaminohydroxyphosphoribosylaminopyrimidine deaminase/5-amino-6-(5-phosphoribosylamino)uracil reductase RibD [Dissulfurispiraceae bacterium]|nr:bifunctional diaminohydroxyphosphoribosylaminopyrimidine deaminase/5-amino-6-(5-phosphoribosylamino)uracil reductase RibD [Dissulfurispiraceae bacterium]
MDKHPDVFSGSDIFFMKRALQLARKAMGMTSPNPMVGAIVVKNGRIVSEDFHKKAGDPHAEALAIQKARGNTKNATLYVTLEPCCHTDKRTPPCSLAVINAGFKKVFVATRDPNPKVSGKGIQELRNHGITVTEGLLEGPAQKLNEAYFKYVSTGRPFVILKTAMTLDGKIATPEGQSKWITGEKARKIVHQMRCGVDAVMTAIGTVKADNPELTARIRCGRQPVRIVIDPNLEIQPDFRVCYVPPETIFVVRRSGPDHGKRLELENRGIKFIEHEGARVDMVWLMEKLGAMGFASILIEAGSSFNAACFREKVVDKVVFFIAPKIICGRSSVPAVGGDYFLRIEEAIRVSDLRVRKVGDDVMIEGYTNKAG